MLIRIHGQSPLVSTLRFGAECKEAFRTKCELAVELLREQARVLGELHLGVFDGVSPPGAVDSI